MDKEGLKLLKKIHKSIEANNKLLKRLVKHQSERNTSRDEETHSTRWIADNTICIDLPKGGDYLCDKSKER